jgi:hypothetical protein
LPKKHARLPLELSPVGFLLDPRLRVTNQCRAIRSPTYASRNRTLKERIEMPSRLRVLGLCLAVCFALALGLGIQALAASQRSAHSTSSIAALERRVSVLEHRLAAQARVNTAQTKFNRAQININTLDSSRLASLETRPTPSLTTTVQIAFGTSDSNGGASATVFCPGGQKVFGGGGGFVGQAYYADHLLWSQPNIAGTSWTASGDGLAAGRSFETYAVCAALG